MEDGGDATSEEGTNEPSPSKEGFASGAYTPRGTGIVQSSIVRDDMEDGNAFDLGVGVYPTAIHPASAACYDAHATELQCATTVDINDFFRVDIWKCGYKWLYQCDHHLCLLAF